MPSAWASAALIGSACETATTARPGWPRTSRSSVPARRACIPVNDSPPGKRKPLGCRCAACHSGRRTSRASLRPVQSPKSHSISPRSARSGSPSACATGRAVSRARSRGEVYTAAMRRSAPSRRARASACRRPSSERCRPGARPGSTMPVAPVRAWRHRSTSVGRGGRRVPTGGFTPPRGPAPASTGRRSGPRPRPRGAARRRRRRSRARPRGRRLPARGASRGRPAPRRGPARSRRAR